MGKSVQQVSLVHDSLGKISGNILTGSQFCDVFLQEAVGEDGVESILCEKFSGIQNVFEDEKCIFRNLRCKDVCRSGGKTGISGGAWTFRIRSFLAKQVPDC